MALLGPPVSVRHPWPAQAAELGKVHAYRCEGSAARSALRAAWGYAARNGYTVESRILGEWLLIRWSRKP